MKPKPTRTKRTRPKKASVRRRKITLLPVMDPRFNAREIIKQMCALEDHLGAPEKQCTDCIRKHFATTELLAEEAVNLECTKYDCPDILKNLASKVRILHHAFEYASASNRDAVMDDVKKRLRPIRKALMQKYAAIPRNKLPDKERAAVAAIHAACARKTKTTTTKTTTGPSSKTRRRRASPAGSRR